MRRDLIAAVLGIATVCGAFVVEGSPACAAESAASDPAPSAAGREGEHFPTLLAAVQIPVTDFTRSAAFYEQLGMKVGVDYSPVERQLTLGAPAQGSDILMLKKPPPGLHPGGAALVFRVSDLKAVVGRLRGAGFPAGEPRDAGPYLVVLVKDPDGNRIEIAQPTGRSTPW